MHPVFERLSEGTASAWAARQRAVYARAQAITAWSDWTARSLVNDFAVDPARVHVVGAGRNHEPPQRTRAPAIVFLVAIGVIVVLIALGLVARIAGLF